jgi:hypothetical protein
MLLLSSRKLQNGKNQNFKLSIIVKYFLSLSEAIYTLGGFAHSISLQGELLTEAARLMVMTQL